MNNELYNLIEALTDSLEWCYEKLEDVDLKDDKSIRDLLAQANRKIEIGYLE